MKVKANKNGKVTYLMRAGKDIVEGTMNVEKAQSILDSATDVKETNNINFPVCADDKWFFPVVQDKKKLKPKSVVKDADNDSEGE